MAGKGDKPRPMKVDRDTYNSNWDQIFRKADKVHIHNDGHEILVQENVSEHWSHENDRTATVVKSHKGHSVQFYEGSQLIRTVDMFEKSLTYAEDAAENWCLGVMV